MAGKKLGRAMRKELLTAVRDRYVRASKIDKGAILDEFVALTGCKRSYATRLRGQLPAPNRVRVPDPQTASTARPSRSL